MPVSLIPHESWYVRRYQSSLAYRGRGSHSNPSSYRPLSVPWQQLSNQQLDDFVWSYGSRAVQPESHHPAPDSSSESDPEEDHPSPRSSTTEQSTLYTLSLPETALEEPPPPAQPANWQQLFRKLYLTHIKPYEETPSEYSRLFASPWTAKQQSEPGLKLRSGREGATNFDNILTVHWSEYFKRATQQ